MECSQCCYLLSIGAVPAFQARGTLESRGKKKRGISDLSTHILVAGTPCKIENVLSYPPSVGSNLALEEEEDKNQHLCLHPTHLYSENITTSQDCEQCLNETGFGMLLEIPPQVPNYILNRVVILPITAKLSFFVTERCPSDPPSTQTCHVVSSFSPSLLSVLGHPRQKAKKKKPVLVPGDQQEWSGGEALVVSSGKQAGERGKLMNAKSSITGYGILTLGPGYPIGPSIPGSPLREEDTES